MKDQNSILPHHRKATACKNLILPFENYSPMEIYEMIRSNAFKETTDRIRALIADGKTYEANELKRHQYGYTPSSVWFPTRRESNIKTITGNIIIECDHLTKTELEHIAWFTYTDVHTMMGFVTSSGSGFKWICPTTATTIEEHRIAYRQLCEYYSSIFGEGINGKLDIKQPDPVRLMFLSCDQSICSFFKTNYRAFIIKREVKQSPDNKERDYFVVPPRNESKQGDAQPPLEIAAQMIREATDGTKHNTLLRASGLLGGYIAGGLVDEADAIQVLEYEISQRNILDFKNARKTIRDGIRYGKTKPIYE